MAEIIDNLKSPQWTSARVPISAGAPSWETRVKSRGLWRSACGTTCEFLFEDVSREIELRQSIFEFPGVDGVYVQRNGVGSRTYPLRCFFSGATCDMEANAFELSLMEPGVGRLTHPFYGTFPCVPVGRITRNDPLVTAANQSIVEVSFLPTLRTVYPSSETYPANEILAACDAFALAAGQQFVDLTNMKTIVDQQGLVESVRSSMIELEVAFSGVPRIADSVMRDFHNALAVMDESVDQLVALPDQLAEEVLALIMLPAEIGEDVALSISDRLNGYSSFADAIMTSDGGNPGRWLSNGTAIDRRTNQLVNQFHLADLMVLAASIAQVRAVVAHTFTNRPDAVDAAAVIQERLDTAVAWRDEGFSDIGTVSIDQMDEGESHQLTQQAVALTSGRLVTVSFSLVPERRIYLDRPRTILDLAHELYKSRGEEKLDELIAHNNLPGDNILELPAGRMIKYYPEAA